MGEAGFLTSSELAQKQSNLDNGYEADGRRPKKVKKAELADQIELAQIFDCLPGEVAIALSAVFKKLGLKVEETGTELIGPMGNKYNVPFAKTFVGKDKISLGWGSYLVEGLGRVQLQTANQDTNGGITCFPRRWAANTSIWDKIVAEMDVELPKVGIFRGHAFKVDRPRDLIVPNYLDLTADVKLILNPEVEQQLDVSMWRVIKHWKALEGKVRRKRGIVMSGNYGTGKTVAAFVTAKLAVDCGLTFMTTIAKMSTTALALAKIVQPCVLFLEDLDQATHGDRDELNDFLNTLSGIESKNTNVILLVSTNFVDRIDRAFLRPERLDTIVEFTPPTRDTVDRLIRAYAGDLLSKLDDISEVTTYMVGATPAIISEAVNLAKIKAITDGKNISVDELMQFSKGLDKQRQLACPQYVEGINAVKLENALMDSVQGAIRGRA